MSFIWLVRHFGSSVHRRLTNHITSEYQDKTQSGERGSGDRAEDRNPAVVPAAVTLRALERKNGMGDTRGKIPCRIDRVACRTSKGHTDRHNEHCDRERAARAKADFRGVATNGEHQDAEHQQPGSDELAEEVPRRIVDGRHRAERTEFRVRIVRSIKMVFIESPNKSGAAEATEHLAKM